MLDLGNLEISKLQSLTHTDSGNSEHEKNRLELGSVTFINSALGIPSLVY